jgi:mannan endo-1,6-alpha-mannosidase
VRAVSVSTETGKHLSTNHLTNHLTNNVASLRAAAKAVADGLMIYYEGTLAGAVPGLLVPPYYWWEAGAFWGAFINFWHITGYTEYVDMTTKGMIWQAGPKRDFMPPNETFFEVLI